MSDAALRSRLIRLAHANPDLRADLLPLLEKQAGQIPPGMSLIEVLTSFLEQGITRAMGRVGVEVSFNSPPSSWLLWMRKTSCMGRLLTHRPPLSLIL